jgi:hypothetical protein
VGLLAPLLTNGQSGGKFLDADIEQFVVVADGEIHGRESLARARMQIGDRIKVDIDLSPGGAGQAVSNLTLQSPAGRLSDFRNASTKPSPWPRAAVPMIVMTSPRCCAVTSMQAASSISSCGLLSTLLTSITMSAAGATLSHSEYSILGSGTQLFRG